MESKENYDVISIVADNVIKWYDQTHTTMTIARIPCSLVNSEVEGILLAARKQTLGTLTTLADKNILSTHALLRILVETFVVLAWVLKVSASEEKARLDEVYKRLRRWDHTRLRKDKALLEDLPQTTEIESAIEKAKADIEKYKKDDIEELPNYQQLFRDLGDKPEKVKEWVETYAQFYRKYSRAIHLNRNVTQNLAWIQYENEKPKAVLYKDDIESDGDELLNIASISCDINKAIRDFYGWQSYPMQNEYKQLELRLEKK
jgi:hypothetical protein